MLFVIGNLKKRNPITFAVPQIHSFYKADLSIRRVDSTHYVTQCQLPETPGPQLQSTSPELCTLSEKSGHEVPRDLISPLEIRGPIFPDACDKKR